MLAALRQNGVLDHAVMGVALVGIAVPNFVVAPVLALVFGVKLGWLPVAGWEPGSVRYLILPVVTLALPFVAYIARLDARQPARGAAGAVHARGPRQGARRAARCCAVTR